MSMKGFKGTGKKIVAGHAFPNSFGFTGSQGRVSVKPHMRGMPKVQKYADGGPVQEPKTTPADQSSLVKRSRPITTEDVQGGGRSPLRAGFAKGGSVHGAKCSCPQCCSSGGAVGKKMGKTMMKNMAPPFRKEPKIK